jgi:hypothetical protein
VGVQLAGTYTSRPGPPMAANLQYTAAEIARTLGRLPSGNVPTISVNLFETNEEFYESIGTLDIRVAKLIRWGRMRANLGIDVYNALNSSTGQTYNGTYTLANPSLWGTPTLIMPARFAKLGAQIDF